MAENRVTQVAVEVLRNADPAATTVRATQVVVEVLRAVGTYTPPAETPRRVTWVTTTS